MPDKFSRINVKLQTNEAGIILAETAINGEGPKISEEEINKLFPTE